jgi:hypothetical protein
MQLKHCMVLIFLIDVVACAFTTPYAFSIQLLKASEEEENSVRNKKREQRERIIRQIYSEFRCLPRDFKK